DGDLELDVVELARLQRIEARIAKGCGERARGDRAIERLDGDDGADAAAQLTVTGERDECAGGTPQYFVVIALAQLRPATVESRFDRVARDREECGALFGGEHAVLNDSMRRARPLLNRAFRNQHQVPDVHNEPRRLTEHDYRIAAEHAVDRHQQSARERQVPERDRDVTLAAALR